jgi:hypothetical protein
MYCEDSSHDMLAVYITKMQHLGQARIHNKPIKYIVIEQTLPPTKCKTYYIYLNIRWPPFSIFSGKYPYNTCSAFLSYIWVNAAYTSHQNNKSEQMDSEGFNAHIMTPCNMVSALLKFSTRTLSFIYQTTWCHNKYANFVLFTYNIQNKVKVWKQKMWKW